MLVDTASHTSTRTSACPPRQRLEITADKLTLETLVWKSAPTTLRISAGNMNAQYELSARIRDRRMLAARYESDPTAIISVLLTLCNV